MAEAAEAMAEATAEAAAERSVCHTHAALSIIRSSINSPRNP